MIDAREGSFTVGGIEVGELCARFGSPLYVYDAEVVRRRYAEIRAAFRHPDSYIHFAAVCNPNLHLLTLLRAEGCGLHANTPGDVYCGQAAGFPSSEIVFSGSNVSEEDLRYLVQCDVHINLDSLDDLRRAVAVAPGRRFGVRVHVEEVLPESRMGLREHEIGEALAIARAAGSVLDSVHIYCGTHGRSVERYHAALERLLLVAAQLPDLACVNLGGGFGYDYRDGSSFPFGELATIAEARVSGLSAERGRKIRLRAEPGRALVAPAAVLLTRVRSVKASIGRRYLGVDTTVANFVAPAVHGAHRRVVSVAKRSPAALPADVCGCTTYSRDVLARDLPLGEVQVGDLLAVLDAGAYGYCMAGHFLNRPRPAEVFVDGGEAKLVTRRERYEDLLALQLGRR